MEAFKAGAVSYVVDISRLPEVNSSLARNSPASTLIFRGQLHTLVAMFKVTHEKYLKESIWESATTGRAEYIEVWKYANVRNILIGHIRLQNDLILIRRRKSVQLITIAMAS